MQHNIMDASYTQNMSHNLTVTKHGGLVLGQEMIQVNVTLTQLSGEETPSLRLLLVILYLKQCQSMSILAPAEVIHYLLIFFF